MSWFKEEPKKYWYKIITPFDEYLMMYPDLETAIRKENENSNFKIISVTLQTQ